MHALASAGKSYVHTLVTALLESCRMSQPASSDIASEPARLRPELGVFGAVLLGLGSIIGTGVFVSLGIAAGVAGPAVVPALAIAALVATFNALSSAQLAASHPVSGGSYEYGYAYLRPWLGFCAGWMFLCAKTASAATAALGFAGYLLSLLGAGQSGRLLLAAATALLLTAIVLCGLRLSNRVNIAIVSFTLLALGAFVLCALPQALAQGPANLSDFGGTDAAEGLLPALLQASALLFVAYTGYGRIATLGEEVHEPRRTIPRAIVIALWFCAALYIVVGLVAVAAVGAAELGRAANGETAPLVVAARQFAAPALQWLIGLGALTAMLGVLLNLILGLSRVLLAMGRRGDMPAVLGRLNAARTTPYAAVIVAGLLIALLTLLGSVKTTWSFSAFTVLIYYAITNLCALNLPAPQRLYGRWLAWCGLGSCLGLAFWVELQIWLSGLALLISGLLWHWAAQAASRRSRNRSTVAG